MEKKKYRVNTWIPGSKRNVDYISSEEDELMIRAEAETELKHLEEMQPENRYEIEEVNKETIKGNEGFWISKEDDKNGIGVKAFPIHGNEGKIDSITIVTISREDDDKIVDEIEIYETEFGRLFQFVDLLRKEIE